MKTALGILALILTFQTASAASSLVECNYSGVIGSHSVIGSHIYSLQLVNKDSVFLNAIHVAPKSGSPADESNVCTRARLSDSPYRIEVLAHVVAGVKAQYDSQCAFESSDEGVFNSWSSLYLATGAYDGIQLPNNVGHPIDAAVAYYVPTEDEAKTLNTDSARQICDRIREF